MDLRNIGIRSQFVKASHHATRDGRGARSPKLPFARPICVGRTGASATRRAGSPFAIARRQEVQL